MACLGTCLTPLWPEAANMQADAPSSFLVFAGNSPFDRDTHWLPSVHYTQTCGIAFPEILSEDPSTRLRSHWILLPTNPFGISEEIFSFVRCLSRLWSSVRRRLLFYYKLRIPLGLWLFFMFKLFVIYWVNQSKKEEICNTGNISYDAGKHRLLQKHIGGTLTYWPSLERDVRLGGSGKSHWKTWNPSWDLNVE